MDAPTASTEYCCPGEAHPISRAVHLGRLAAFYPACRQCPMRDDTGPLSPRRAKRLAETRRRGLPQEIFHEGLVSGVHLNDLGPAETGRLAAAFGMLLGQGERGGSALRPASSSATRPVEFLLASDGRPLAAEMVFAASEGLRWAGCGVVDVGAASAPCVDFATRQVGGAAMLIGNPTGRQDTVGIRFWRGGELLGEGPAFDELRRLYESPLDRPTRRFGPLRRGNVETEYLARFAPFYHGLRPLRFVVHSTCRPALDYLGKLLGPTACEMLPSPALPRRAWEEIVRTAAHFGAAIADDGQSLRLWDEQGREVASGGPSPALPDALDALTRLLALLSRSDRPLSTVLDTAAAAS